MINKINRLFFLLIVYSLFQTMDTSSYIEIQHNQCVSRIYWLKDELKFWVYTATGTNSYDFYSRSAIDTSKRLLQILLHDQDIHLEYVFGETTTELHKERIKILNSKFVLTNDLLLDYLILLVY